MKRFSRAAVLGATALAAGLVGTAAQAQVETITVTAQKREQTLQEVPIAVTVVQAETIQNAQIMDALDLQSVVPALRVSQLERSSNATFIIRGQGNGANNPGIEPSVAVYIDGVFRARAGTALSDLMDIERVEVLRGPQSTLFGKNATAGVVSFITQEPQFEFGGVAEATVGNFNQRIVRGSVTGPLSENLAFSLSGSRNTRDGYYENTGPGGDFNDRNRWALRGQLLFMPSDNLSLRLIADWDEIDERCCGTDRVIDGPTGAVIRNVLGGQTSAGPGFNYQIATDFANENQIENRGLSLQGDWNLNDNLTLSSITAYRRYDDFVDYEGDFTTLALLGENVRGLDVRTFTQEFRLTGDWNNRAFFLLGAFFSNEDMTVTDARIYGSDARAYVDLLSGGAISMIEAATPFPAGSFYAAGGGTRFTADQTDRQMQIFGQVDFNLTDRLTLTAGLAYFRSEKEVDFRNVVRTNPFSDLNLVAIGEPLILAGLIGANPLFTGTNPQDPAQVGAFAVANPAVFAALQAAANSASTVFPSSGAPVSNPLLALYAAGLQPLGAMTPFPNSVEDGRTRDTDWPYTLRLAYDLTDNLNVYASFARGYKASSWNLTPDTRPNTADVAALRAAGELAADNALGAPTIVNTAEALGVAGNQRFARPEITETFEIGIKSQFNWGFLNVAVFDQTVTDFQASIFQGAGFAVVNAGEQSAQGLEFDASISPPPIPGLTINLSGIWMNAKYDRYPGAPVVRGSPADLADGVEDGRGDLSGASVAGIPSFSGSFGFQYARDFNFGEAFVRADYQYASETNLGDSLPASLTRKVGTLNASVGVNLNNGVEALLWARNLNGDEYYTAAFPTTLQAGSFSAYANQPRTYGLTLRARF